MRGDGVGVGDVGEVHDGASSSGDKDGHDDGREPRRNRKHGFVCGRRGGEHSKAGEPGRNRVGVGDGARGKPGAGVIYGDNAVGTDGMRGDGVGVGDVGEVPCWARFPWDSSGGDDGRGAVWEHE